MLVRAHRILGLNALVVSEGDRADIRLGQGNPHIVVDMSFANTCLRVASVTLLDSTKVIEPGFFRIQPGVPVRNGVRKHAIIDGPVTGIDGSRWAARHKGGESIALSCIDDVEPGNSNTGNDAILSYSVCGL